MSESKEKQDHTRSCLVIDKSEGYSSHPVMARKIRSWCQNKQKEVENIESES